MEQITPIVSVENIEKKNTDSEDDSEHFRKLLGQIITEIILKRRKNHARRWVYKDK